MTSRRPIESDFEALSRTREEKTFWLARDFMGLLGYLDYATFRLRVIERAYAACIAAGISALENFRETRVESDGELREDFELTRFGCYLCAMSADARKEEVARALVYFARIAELVTQHLQEVEQVDRLLIRDKVAQEEKVLSSTASRHGVLQYAFFQNSGYLGMYNMNLKQLRRRRGLGDKAIVLDFMGRQELAANQFRITETEARIRKNDVYGQSDLEVAARTVGQEVRETMIRTSGTKPEQLPAFEDINRIRMGLRGTARRLAKRDQLRLRSPRKRI